MTRALPIVLVGGLFAASCSSNDEATESQVEVEFRPGGTTSAPPRCPVDFSPATPEWPFVVPAALAVESFDVDGTNYTLRGVSADGEQTLVDTMENVFGQYEIDEPTGGATDVQVAFESDFGTAVLEMADDDNDGCWNTVIRAEYTAQPELIVPGADGAASDDGGDAVAEGVGDGAAPDDPPSAPSDSGDPDPLGNAPTVGTAQLIGARGAFALDVVECVASPLVVRAVGDAGSLEMRGLPGTDEVVEVIWIYADDEERISDPEAQSFGFDDQGGTVVADGENRNGPETLVIEVTC